MDIIDVFQYLPFEICSLIHAIIWEAASLTFENGSVISSHTL